MSENVCGTENLMDEKLNGGDAQLKDADLEQVNGGGSGDIYIHPSGTGKYYKLVGDRSWAYRCPACKHSMYYSNWGIFFCDPCDTWYTVESKLENYADLNSGSWVEVTWEEYNKYHIPF